MTVAQLDVNLDTTEAAEWVVFHQMRAEHREQVLEETKQSLPKR